MGRLLINLSSYNKSESGLEIYAKNLLPHLRSLNPILLSAFQIDGFECFPVQENMSTAYKQSAHIRRLWWTQQSLPKIYKHLNGSLLFSPIIEAPLDQRVRSVITIHDAIPLRFASTFRLSSLYHRFFLPHVAKRAVHVFCNSNSTAEDSKRYYGVSSDKISITYLGIDEKQFYPIKNEQEKKYFLYIGRNEVNKNLFRIIDAFQSLQVLKSVELWIVGKKDSENYPTLKKFADQTSVASKVRFIDYLPSESLPSVISNAIALVYPSLWEGFGLPVVEAMACGTPVITSSISSLPEVAGEAAILVNPYNTFEIKNAMQRILDDPMLSNDLIQKGFAQAQKFNWAITGEKTLNKLKELL